MPQPGRREFLQYVGMGAAAAFLPIERQTPELVLYNANIITMDPALPGAQAVAVAGGRFLAVGANDEVRPLATALTRSLDLEGRTAVPGFIDAHTHPAVAGRMHLRMVSSYLKPITQLPGGVRAARWRIRRGPDA